MSFIESLWLSNFELISNIDILAITWTNVPLPEAVLTKFYYITRLQWVIWYICDLITGPLISPKLPLDLWFILS